MRTSSISTLIVKEKASERVLFLWDRDRLRVCTKAPEKVKKEAQSHTREVDSKRNKFPCALHCTDAVISLRTRSVSSKK